MAHSDPNDPRLEPVLAALAALKRAEKVRDARRDDLATAVAEAIRAGVRPAELVRRTGYSAETIRQIARDAGIEPLRPPTVTSIRNLPVDHPKRQG